MDTTYDKKQINKFRRRNAKLYPIYKMVSWDLLFFYSIEFLFLTIAKGISPAQVLIANGFYFIFSTLMQIPAVVVTDFLGRRNSMIFGNIMLIVYMLIYVYFPGMISVIIANAFCAFGYAIKTIAESNLLYDSVSTKGGDGLYSKIDSKGASWYYILDGVASLTAGYLFVMDNFLPMYICLGFIVLSTILSFGFKDIYDVTVKKDKNTSLTNTLKEYGKDLKTTLKFILKSKRMKAFILFQIAFYSLITIIDIYQGDLLVNMGVPEEEFSMIFAALIFIGGISISLRETIEKKFKNRTLAFISLIYVGAVICVGSFSKLNTSSFMIPIILILYVIIKACTSIWYILENKYLKNFTNEEIRNRITFTYEFVGALAASISSIIGAIFLEKLSIENSFLIVGLIWLVFIVLVLDYMKTRIGLKPDEYKAEDIDF